jgi:predicted enzyme related to lactoylglutathione lyase
MAKPAVSWFEVTGKDGAALQRFYSKLFDWQVQDQGDGSGYGMVQAESGIGGGIGPSQDGGPGMVTFYVEVDDPAAYLARAEQLGGKTVMPPTEIPDVNLTYALFTDPEGHAIGLMKSGA